MRTKIIHEPTTYYFCDYCQYQSISREDVEDHERKHKQDRCNHRFFYTMIPYKLERKCQDCGFTECITLSLSLQNAALMSLWEKYSS